MDDQKIRKTDLKVTAPRVKILELLENSSERHVSAEDINSMLSDAGGGVGLT
ncbi:transcriptional repressor [Candidatus Vondammii sp. HM_W22]|uniref:transcriptional repressor n=1 Tax=Candidatus Vondammii sp. HM_W22 TaxID=2687299 RepID=UPI001F132BAF